MKDITVSREKLISIIEKNKKEHIEQYKNAVKGYMTTMEKTLEKELKRIRGTPEYGEFNLYNITKLTTPQSYEKEYETILMKLNLDESPTIILDHQDFKNFVQDDWGWKAAFTHMASGYSMQT